MHNCSRGRGKNLFLMWEMHMGKLVLLGEALLMAGAVLGVFWGTNGPIWMQRYALSGTTLSTSLVLLGLVRGIFPVAAILCAVSLAGIVMLPLLVMLRGAVLGCGAAILVSTDKSGFLIALFVVGLPALLNFPPFLMLCAEGAAFSNGVRQRCRGGGLTIPFRRPFLWFLVSVIIVPISVLLEAYVVPFLVSLI